MIFWHGAARLKSVKNAAFRSEFSLVVDGPRSVLALAACSYCAKTETIFLHMAEIWFNLSLLCQARRGVELSRTSVLKS